MQELDHQALRGARQLHEDPQLSALLARRESGTRLSRLPLRVHAVPHQEVPGPHQAAGKQIIQGPHQADLPVGGII